MNKLGIIKTIKEAFILLKKNPVIFVPAFISALISTSFAFYSSVYAMFTLVLGLAGLLANVFLVGLLIRTIYECKTRTGRRGRKISFEELSKIAAGRLVRLFLASIVFLFIVVLMALPALALFLELYVFPDLLIFTFAAVGFVLTLAPLVYVSLRLSFYQYAIIIDNKGVFESLKKSWKVAHRNVGRLFLMQLLISVMSALFMGLLGFVIVLMVGLGGLGIGIIGANSINPALIFIQAVVNFISNLLIVPFDLSIFAIVYLKLRKS